LSIKLRNFSPGTASSQGNSDVNEQKRRTTCAAAGQAEWTIPMIEGEFRDLSGHWTARGNYLKPFEYLKYFFRKMLNIAEISFFAGTFEHH
jgi:hypothetical protein